MPSKPKKNTRKEIRGWAVVDEKGNLVPAFITHADDCLNCGLSGDGFTILSTLEDAQNFSSLDRNDIKRCRIILD